ncbi:MAG: hypothetical protein AAF182_00685 [Pseudomonadota bacterium]
MAKKDKYATTAPLTESAHPFDSAEEAWFWFINAQAAKNDGARITARQGSIIRPCEPVDILNILDRLYRTRRLIRDHLLVLRHYGRRQMAPDIRRPKEMRSAHLWREALSRLETVLQSKGIVREQQRSFFNEHHTDWSRDVILYEGQPA